MGRLRALCGGGRWRPAGSRAVLGVLAGVLSAPRELFGGSVYVLDVLGIVPTAFLKTLMFFSFYTVLLRAHFSSMVDPASLGALGGILGVYWTRSGSLGCP